MKQLCFEIRKKHVADILGLDFEKVRFHWIVFIPEEQRYTIIDPSDLHNQTHIENFDQIMMKTMS